MEIVNKASGETHGVIISPVSKNEISQLKKSKYSFNWRVIAKDYPLVKLKIEGQDEILGVLALAVHPGEQRIEIKLLASSKENIGLNKKFDGIAACLIAYACGEAVKNFGELACVSLVPKTLLKKHYMLKYGMLDGGRQVFLEGKLLFDLARKNL
jgi:hypothetical protein